MAHTMGRFASSFFVCAALLIGCGDRFEAVSAGATTAASSGSSSSDATGGTSSTGGAGGAGGNAGQTASAGTGTATTTSTSGTTGGAGGGGGASTTWCEVHGAPYTLCADFDGALDAGWDSMVFNAGGSITASADAWTSAPFSAHVVTPFQSVKALVTGFSRTEAFLPSSAELAFDLSPASAASVAGEGGIVLAHIHTDNFSFDYWVGNGGYSLSITYQEAPFILAVPAPGASNGSFTRVALTVVFAELGGKVVLSYDGVDVGSFPDVQTLDPTDSPLTGVVVGHIAFGDASAFESRFDNVTWLAKP